MQSNVLSILINHSFLQMPYVELLGQKRKRAHVGHFYRNLAQNVRLEPDLKHRQGFGMFLPD